jgi:hypothetical protein
MLNGGKEMKKKKIMTGVAIGAALTGVVFGGCGRVQNLYGPPPETDEPVFQSETDSSSTMETLYGPPADLTTETDESKATEPGVTEFQAEENMKEAQPEPSTAAPLYGPPADVAE